MVDALRDVTFPIDLPARLEALERELILRALRQTGFNRTTAAPLLGLNFRQLRYRIQQLEIRDERDGREGRDDSESMAEGEGREGRDG
ncbi:Bacterial regulatory protein, Fis family [compost metagenome]